MLSTLLRLRYAMRQATWARNIVANPLVRYGAKLRRGAVFAITGIRKRVL